MDYLKVVEVSDVQTAEKDGRKFKTLYCQALLKFGDQLQPFGKPQAINVWEMGPKDPDTGEFTASSTGWLYKSVKLGQPIAGKLVTRTVDDYDINGKSVNSYTMVVLQRGHEALTEDDIRRAFEAQKHPVVDNNQQAAKKAEIEAEAELPGM